MPPRLPSPSRQYSTPQVVHVVHHSKHHSKDKHKHGHSPHRHHHHSHSEVPSSSTLYPMPSPNAITPTSSYSYSSDYVSSGPPLLQPQQRLHYSHSRPALMPAESVDVLAQQFAQKAVLTKMPRPRTSSQPTLPTGHAYIRPSDAAYSGYMQGYIPDPRNTEPPRPARRRALCVSVTTRPRWQ